MVLKKFFKHSKETMSVLELLKTIKYFFTATETLRS